jgi:glycosyltransferase involved in cell wall biosynthesis
VNFSTVTSFLRETLTPHKAGNGRGANFVGYLQAATGMGEAGRSTLRALRAQNYPVWTYTLSEATSVANPRPKAKRGPYPINLFQFNADVTPHLFNELGKPFLQGRKNIGLWSWEMTEFPVEWHDRFTAFREIWVPSPHIRQALARIAPVQVYAMPHVIEPGSPENFTRNDFGLPGDMFLFLFAFDALSVVERKNPFAVIDAYRLAFGAHPAHTTLIIKVNNRALVHGETARYLGVDEDLDQHLASAVASVSGILLDTRLDRARAHALINLCDCYVSLHRCEGFGLTIAEAMYFGKPCIATAYSANMDFMNPLNSYPVNYRMVELERAYGPYRAGWTWAEPDVEQAAAWMQSVVREPEEASRRGVRAAQDIRRQFNPRAVGAQMVERLDANPAKCVTLQ